MRTIRAGQEGEGEVVLMSKLTNRGNDTVWIPDENAELGYSLLNVPIYLRWIPDAHNQSTRWLSHAFHHGGRNPLLMDHAIAVYQFTAQSSIDAEIYYATSVFTTSYFEGHYLKAVTVELEAASLVAEEGWFWIPTAQSMGNLISYIMEPETDDNLITWGYTDHLLVENQNTTERQTVPMMRVTTHQPMAVLRVPPYSITTAASV